MGNGTGERGQATVEHLGLVAVVAVVMLAAGAVSAVGAPGVLNRVIAGFDRALCVVVGQRCEQLEREPCPVRRQTDKDSQSAGFSWLRIGHDRVLFIERRSDGSYLLSLVEGARAGGGIGRRGSGGAAEAALTLGWKGGRQYLVSTPAEARALVRRLRRDPVPALSTEVAAALDLTGIRDADAAVDAYVLSGDAALDAVAKAGLSGLLEGGGELATSEELGLKIAAHRKEITAYVKADAKIAVFADALTGIALHGRPRQPRQAPKPEQASPAKPDLAKRPAAAPDPASSTPAGPRGGVEATAMSPMKPLEGALSGMVALRFGPGPALLGLEVVVSASTATAQRELRARLDPSDPAVAAAVQHWRRKPASADAMRALGEAAAGAAALDDRTFSLADHKRSSGLASLPPLRELGAAITSERAIGLLEEQRSRPGHGVWEMRLDCVAVAGR